MNTTATDNQYRNALKVVLKTNRASTSRFQRKLGVDYKTASEMMDLMEKKGIISPRRMGGGGEVHMERLKGELGLPKRMKIEREPMDTYLGLNEKVNVLASTVTETAYKLIEETVDSGKDIYRTLIKKLGKPVRVMFKIERRRSKDVVVGGELQFKGTEFLEGLIVGEDAVDVRGKECGGSMGSFGECNERLSNAVVEMFVKLYERKER